MIIRAYGVENDGAQISPISYERSISEQEVLVKIAYCGLATGDMLFINNFWGDTNYPMVPGHEMIGVVDQVGIKVKDLAKGDKVGIGFQLGACFNCEQCQSGNEQFCAEQKVIAINSFGGLADFIVADSRFVFKLSDRLYSPQAVPLLSSGLTVYSAIKYAALSANARVGVIGVGGLGQLAIKFLIRMGHQVHAFSHTSEKKEVADKLGASFTLTANGNLLESINYKFDLILSTLSLDYELEEYLKLLKPRGKFCVVAAPMHKQPINLGLLYDFAQKSVYGSYIGSRKEMQEMLDFAEANQIESDIKLLDLSQVQPALDMLNQGKQKHGIVIKIK